MTAAVQTEMRYAKLTGVVRWSGGSRAMRLGEAFPAASMLVRERPDLFDAVVPAELVGAPARLPRCWNWRCKAEFTPGGNAGAVQRYCTPGCRKERETELRKAVRLVTKRKYPTQPQSHGRGAKQSCYRHLQEMEGLLALVRALIEHLGGRLEIGPPPEVDEPLLASLSNRGALLDLAKRSYMELMERRNKAQDALGQASTNEEHDAKVNGASAARNRLTQNHIAIHTQWDDQLAHMDEADGLQAINGIR